MKKQTKIYRILIIAAFTLCVIGCDSVFSPQPGGGGVATNSNTGKGLVQIHIGTAAGRTLLPSQTDMVIDAWDLVFTGVTDSSNILTITSSGLNQPIPVNAGQWTLTLSAKKDGTVIASGTAAAAITVTAGQTASATVTLEFAAPAGGAGSLNWDITNSSVISPNSDGIQIELTPLSGGSTPETIGSSLTGTKSDISAGYYLVTAALAGDGKKAVKSDIAHIYKGQTTKLNWTFLAADFHAAIENVWLVGAMNTPEAWKLPGTEMTEQADGTFAWTGYVAGSRNFRFSLLDTHEWPANSEYHNDGYNQWWGHWFAPENDNETGVGINLPVNYHHYTKTDNAWQLSADGWYKIVLDPYLKTMTVTALSPPVISCAAITNSAKSTITVTFSKAVTMTGVSPYGFSVTGTGSSSIGMSSIAEITSSGGTTWEFTLAREAAELEPITLAYSGDAVKDSGGIPLQAITSQSVTNTVKAYPQLLTAVVENAADNQLVLTFSKAVTIGGSAPYGFTLNAASGINITGTSTSSPPQTTWTFNLSRAVTTGETITLSYSVSDVVDGDSNSLKAITNQAVTNNVGLTAVAPATNAALSDAGVATWTDSIDEANVNNYTVILYKGANTLVETRTVATGVGTYNFLSKICENLSAGPENFYITVKAIGKSSYADSTAAASSALTVTQLSRATLLWSNGTDEVTLTGDATVSTSFTIPAGKKLIVPTGKTVTAGKLILAEGTWEAIGASAALTTDTLTFANTAGSSFGAGDGSTAVVLTGANSGTNTFIASGTTAITLGQAGNSLSVTGTAGDETLTLGATAGIYVKAGEKITISNGKLAAGAYLELGTGEWKALTSAAKIGEDKIALHSTPYSAFGSENGARLAVDDNITGDIWKNFTATGATVTLSQSGNNLTIAGAGAKLTLDGQTKFYVPASTELTLSSGTLELTPTAAIHAAASGLFTAGKLELGEGYWKATNVAAEITTHTITLGSDASPGFGSADGATATTLTGGSASTNTFTASGTKVTLSQENDGKAIRVKGSAVTDVLTLGNSARIYVKDGLKIENAAVAIPAGSGAVVEVPAGGYIYIENGGKFAANLLELGPGSWNATDAAAEITADTITLGNHAGPGFGNGGGANSAVLSGSAVNTNTFTASGATVTLGQSGNNLTITGASAAATLSLGAGAKIFVKGGQSLTITTATVDLSAGTDWQTPIVLGGGINEATRIVLTDGDSVLLLEVSSQTDTRIGGWENNPANNFKFGGDLTIMAAASGSGARIGSIKGKTGIDAGHNEDWYAISNNHYSEPWLAKGMTTNQ
jgi:hypothetical protein